MYAREVRKRDARGGYRFEILGDFETDARGLFKLLRERIRQGLSVRHVEQTEHGWQLTIQARGNSLTARCQRARIPASQPISLFVAFDEQSNGLT